MVYRNAVASDSPGLRFGYPGFGNDWSILPQRGSGDWRNPFGVGTDMLETPRVEATLGFKS
jgi:hypothetical protein